MPGFLQRRAHNQIRKTVGMVGREPRILNMDTGLNIIGYIEVNKNATTPFSRGKVHKGTFCCPITDVQNGALIYDRADKAYYFLMDGKTEVYRGQEVYVDATMYRCDSLVTVERFSAEGARDHFGRPVTATPTAVATDVYAMFNPQNFDVMEQQDRLLAHNKIKVCLQSSVGVQEADRIICEDGSKYYVSSIDTRSLKNLTLCVVDTDTR